MMKAIAKALIANKITIEIIHPIFLRLFTSSVSISLSSIFSSYNCVLDQE